MSRTSDTNNLFQSDAQYAQAAYRQAKSRLYEKAGDPIKLSSKPLRVIVKQPVASSNKSTAESEAEAEAWIAESGFVVRRLGLETGKTLQIYRGHLGPVTSIAFYTVPQSKRELLVSGSWDKSFRVWDIKTKTLLSSTVAHIDFVKAVHVLPALRVLVTGSSDRDLRLWDLSIFDTWDWSTIDAQSTSAAGKDPVETESEVVAEPRFGAAPPSARAYAPLPLLSVLKGHTRPIERLASYVITHPSEKRDQAAVPTDRWALISADSMGAMKTWEVERDHQAQVTATLRCEWRPHEIGVYDINLVAEEGEMWTVSADSSLLLSMFTSETPSKAPQPVLRIPHPIALKSVLHLPTLNFVLTGAADEAIRAFDLTSSDLDLDQSAAAQTAATWNGLPVVQDAVLPGLISQLEGHTHEVTDLHSYVHRSSGTSGKKELWIMSASVDGTIRRWRWSDVLNPPPPPTMTAEEEEEKDKRGAMTAEEEAELDELMADD